jgi:hypothetical protein
MLFVVWSAGLSLQDPGAQECESCTLSLLSAECEPLPCSSAAACGASRLHSAACSCSQFLVQLLPHGDCWARVVDSPPTPTSILEMPCCDTCMGAAAWCQLTLILRVRTHVNHAAAPIACERDGRFLNTRRFKLTRRVTQGHRQGDGYQLQPPDIPYDDEGVPEWPPRPAGL